MASWLGEDRIETKQLRPCRPEGEMRERRTLKFESDTFQQKYSDFPEISHDSILVVISMVCPSNCSMADTARLQTLHSNCEGEQSLSLDPSIRVVAFVTAPDTSVIWQQRRAFRTVTRDKRRSNFTTPQLSTVGAANHESRTSANRPRAGYGGRGGG